MSSGSRGTNRGGVPQGRAPHTLLPELPKELEHVPGRAPGAALAGAPAELCAEGGVWPGGRFQRCRPPEPSVLGDTAHDPALHPGQAEAERTQGSKDAPASGRPELCRSAPPPRSIEAPADWELQWLLLELTLGLESWQQPLLLFLLVSLCFGD